jgi:hypothetical protein
VPYLNGQRVSFEEWRKANPVGPLYGRTPEGERYTIYPGEQATEDVLAAHEAKAEARRDRGLALVMSDLGEAATGPLVRGSSDQHAAWLDSLAGEPEDEDAAPSEQNGEVIAVPADHEPVQNVGTSGAWAADRDLPTHSRTRRSQTPLGRHERYVRSQAAKAHVTPEVYDDRMTSHPDGCPWQLTIS